MKLCGRVAVCVWLVLLGRIVCCLLCAVLIFGVLFRISAMTEEVDGLLISIGRVIRLVLELPAGFLSVVEDFAVFGEGLVILLVVVWLRLVGPVVIVLLEPGAGL